MYNNQIAMSYFNNLYTRLLQEMMNTAGGAGVFGSVDSGSTGNQFPSQNDNAYAPGDARVPKILGKRRKRIKLHRRAQAQM